MPLLYDDKEKLIQWASERSDSRYHTDAVAIGRASSDGTIRAVTVYDRFMFCDCNIHVASDGSGHWGTREFFCAAFAYPFIQCGLRRVTALVPAKNKRALRLDLHLGFEFEGRCRNMLPDDDLIILGMLRENCRYIPKEYRHA